MNQTGSLPMAVARPSRHVVWAVEWGNRGALNNRFRCYGQALRKASTASGGPYPVIAVRGEGA